MEKKRREKGCKIIKEITKVNFNIERGLLNSAKICFKKKLRRKERDMIDKSLEKNKINRVWGNECVLIK